MENNDKEIIEVSDGVYDEDGFYRTPNGSFWDPDGVYFNKEGYDKHGGFYDDELEYQPGKGWIEHLMCYEDEKDEVIKIDHINYEHHEDEHEEVDQELDELYLNVDYDELLRDMEKKYSISYSKQEEIHKLYKPNKLENITEDMLFNKIPDNLKKQEDEVVIRKEKKIEVDSLFA